MCGITGLFNLNGDALNEVNSLENACDSLKHRGPDNSAIYKSPFAILGHTRLSIIDTSNSANQPISDISGRYTMVFNGEIYNFKELKKELIKDGISFKSQSDTEVLLYYYIKHGVQALKELNGFFAFAVYDALEKTTLIARDRFGIKPLYFYHSDLSLYFGSELKSLLKFSVPREINYESLFFYMQLNYIPEPYSIFKNIQKLKKGHYLVFNKTDLTQKSYYSPSITYPKNKQPLETSASTLYNLLHNSVEQRMVSDVPIGSFLSGGLDSSIIAACAKKFTNKLNTYSIGYKDEPLYDESKYANQMAGHLGTNHHSFMLSNDDLYTHLDSTLSSIDEPFADSSALAVSILSKHTREHVTVSLSGDGGDELFGGYNKHKADYMVRNGHILSRLSKQIVPFIKLLPKSRSSTIGNVFRQLEKLGNGAKLKAEDRYWRWCCFSNANDARSALLKNLDTECIGAMKDEFLPFINNQDFNSVLLNDIHLVLANDMLTKVDRMSMAHSLEVRVPFLDQRIVDFSLSLKPNFKIRNGIQKYILKDAFKKELPLDIIERRKHGFEVPLLKWFKGDLYNKIDQHWLSKERITQQGIFNPNYTESLKKRLFDSNSGDTPLDIWKLIVFQSCFENYLDA